MFADMPISGGQPQDTRILTSCPQCHAAYNPLKTEILGERDDAHLVYLECRSCGSQVMAVVENNGSGLTSIGTVTDLSRHELHRFQTQRPVAADDVVDLYERLERLNDFLPGGRKDQR